MYCFKGSPLDSDLFQVYINEKLESREIKIKQHNFIIEIESSIANIFNNSQLVPSKYSLPKHTDSKKKKSHFLLKRAINKKKDQRERGE